ncbi:hypothetical protein LTR84_009140 [Exophiala bonariae]|uniref:Uncharacterized protein n=1 Tax=Exophiala bonariae TaxID=1690606 RepID=A0AAV9MXS6_9EURO|nr:hypothetical protein LTR84_009140 [Exophiala bonariae]
MLLNHFFLILTGALYCQSKATANLEQILPRQDTTLVAGPDVCRDPDIDTDPQKAFNDANGIDLILDVMEQIGSRKYITDALEREADSGLAAGFPSLLVSQIVNDPSFVFDCTDLSKPGNCRAPTGPVETGGQVCTELKTGVTGRSTDAGVVVIQSYVRMYGFLHNSLIAIDAAKANIESLKLLDAMATDLKPKPDTAGKILVEILEIAIGFIPIAGPELLVLRTAVKVATKIAKSVTKKSLKDKDDNQPPTTAELQSYLDQVATDFKNAITEQHAQMFLLENTDGTGRDNSQAKWLDQGTQLALKVTADQLTSNIETNLVGIITIL